ncbi:MAG: lipopolysaccharide core heptose(I) kinase RfaP, partial [Gammaproteobacteria bacterium]
MKLAFCLFNYFPYGGLQRDFLRIAQACQARGHEVHVYTMRWEGENPGLTVHLLKATGWQNHTRSAAFAEQVKQAIEREGYDLVVGFNKMPYLDVYYAADVCYQARVREQRSAFYRLLPRYRQYKAFEEAVFARGHSPHILLLSALQQEDYQRCYQTESDRFHLLPPGIAKDRLAPANAAEIRAAMRQRYSIASDDVLLLMVGSGFKTKGLDRILVGLASLPPALKARCHLFVIGQGDPAPFQKLAERVQFLGGRPDVPDFLLAADLLLHPAYHENTGTVLLEALAAGLPVLTVEVCGYAHYVREANAGVVLSSPFQQADFNAALEKMIVSGEHSAWQKNGIAFAKQTDIYSLPEKAADLILSFPPRPRLKGSFDDFMALRGESFRHQEGRLTQRVILDNKSYFIKQHTGVGWREIFKNLFQLRLPVISAKNEWQAIQRLQSLGLAVPAVVRYGQRGFNPAKRQSFILMEELAPVISLETLCQAWPHQPPSFAFKQALLQEVSRIARVMHQHGINHRDFYICHFLLDTASPTRKLYLIDLHRAQCRHLTPQRWIIKDLVGLYFSSKDIGLTQR